MDISALDQQLTIIEDDIKETELGLLQPDTNKKYLREKAWQLREKAWQLREKKIQLREIELLTLRRIHRQSQGK